MSENYLTRIEIQNFTAFGHLQMNFCPGINLLIGNGGTGKSHLLKLLYSTCTITLTGQSLLDRLLNSFLPSSRDVGRLVHHTEDSADISINRGIDIIQASLFRNPPWPSGMQVSGEQWWYSKSMHCVFLPTKDLLANAPGFLSLWDRREIYFEEEFAETLQRAYLPGLRTEKTQGKIKRILHHLETAIQGHIVVKGEEFFYVSNSGELEFSLLADSTRKLGLLWLLIRNGVIGANSILFWDDPTISFDSELVGQVADIIIEISRIPCQIFLTTRDSNLLTELASKKLDGKSFKFHRLRRDSKTRSIKVESV